MSETKQQAVYVAITGASGAIYALRLIEQLLKSGELVYVTVSKAGTILLASEENLNVGHKPEIIHQRLVKYFNCDPNQLRVFGEQDWFAPPASGSAFIKGMVVVPCTTGTLGAIASGVSNCLINRAADVCMKEKRNLIMVVRETPFSSIHLENMLKLDRAGATIMPANPGFYHNPKSILDIVDYMVARILDHLSVEQTLLAEWGK